MPKTVRFSEPIILAGGGALDRAMLSEAGGGTRPLIAADGAADRCLALGHRPDWVIGDMDSVRDRTAWGDRALHLAEQDTTDFEKCLYATEAPLYLGVGFTGARVDHTLAVLSAMLRRPEKRVVLLGEADAIALAPPGREIALRLGIGARVSLFPLRPVMARFSAGLEWPVDGLAMAPEGQIGTSNRAVAETVRLRFDRPGAVLILERRAVETLVAAVLNTPAR